MPWKKGNRLHAVSEPTLSRKFAQSTQTSGKSSAFRSPLDLPGLRCIPRFPGSALEIVRALVDSGEFFHLAERLRADAYTRAHNYFEIVKLSPRLDDFILAMASNRN